MQSVVLVEDNPIDSIIISAKFNDSSLAVKVVTSLEDLSSQFSGTDIALLLLDLNLPTTRGIRSLSYAKELRPTTPIIVVTGFLSADIKQTLLTAGAIDVIDKACLDAIDLAQLVSSIISRASAPRE